MWLDYLSELLENNELKAELPQPIAGNCKSIIKIGDFGIRSKLNSSGILHGLPRRGFAF